MLIIRKYEVNESNCHETTVGLRDNQLDTITLFASSPANRLFVFNSIWIILRNKFLFFRFHLFIFREREGREKERERNINVWLPLAPPPLETWPATQACALTGNQTCDPLLHSLVLSPLSHTSQGRNKLFKN